MGVKYSQLRQVVAGNTEKEMSSKINIMAWLGRARHGEARLGEARHGLARQGKEQFGRNETWE